MTGSKRVGLHGAEDASKSKWRVLESENVHGAEVAPPYTRTCLTEEKKKGTKKVLLRMKYLFIHRFLNLEIACCFLKAQRVVEAE